jgi:hypothetical protein
MHSREGNQSAGKRVPPFVEDVDLPRAATSTVATARTIASAAIPSASISATIVAIGV